MTRACLITLFLVCWALKFVSPNASPPVILSPPLSQTINAGDGMSFFVLPAGTEPLAFQWRLNGTNLYDAWLRHEGPGTTNLQVLRVGAEDVPLATVVQVDEPAPPPAKARGAT